jgi:hypothetical protein
LKNALKAKYPCRLSFASIFVSGNVLISSLAVAQPRRA